MKITYLVSRQYYVTIETDNKDTYLQYWHSELGDDLTDHIPSTSSGLAIAATLAGDVGDASKACELLIDLEPTAVLVEMDLPG
jgi:hypothetical protein